MIKMLDIIQGIGLVILWLLGIVSMVAIGYGAFSSGIWETFGMVILLILVWTLFMYLTFKKI